MRFNKLVYALMPFISTALMSCGGTDSSTESTPGNDAEMINMARQAVIDADVVQYDFSEREARIDRSDPDLVRIVFVLSAKDRMGGDPVVYLTKTDGSISRIEYTR